MALFPQPFIDEVRGAADIVTVISDYVSLRKAGTTYKGLCPFHGEKTPSFSVNRDPADLIVVVVFGILGYFMRRYGYPRPAMILGLVLGDLMEKYLYRSVASYGFTWLGRPAVIVLLILAAGSLVLTLRGRMKARQEASPASFSGAMARSEDES